MRHYFSSNQIILLLIISFLIRIIVFYTYVPIIYADTGWYNKVAHEIITMDFSHYDGARAPGYPVVMILGGLKWKGIWIIQMLMGICISILLYLITLAITKKETFSFWVGLSYNLSSVFVFFESNMLTETACTFFLVVTIYLCLKLFNEINNLRYYFLISLSVSMLSLTRPLFLYMYPLIFLFLFLDFKNRKNKLRISFRQLTYYLMPFLFIVIGYFTFNKITINYFGSTTLSGLGIVNHFLQDIKLAPDEYSSIRDIYLKHRMMQIEHPNYWHGEVIWPASVEIKAVNNWTYAELSNRLTALSIWFILNHPEIYLKSVSNAYFHFWYKPTYINYFAPEKFDFRFLRNMSKLYLDIELQLWLVLNFLFLICFFYFIYFSIKIRELKSSKFMILLFAIVFAVSILQALMAAADNWRYSFPIKPIILLLLFLSFRNYFRSHSKNKNIDNANLSLQ